MFAPATTITFFCVCYFKLARTQFKGQSSYSIIQPCRYPWSYSPPTPRFCRYGEVKGKLAALVKAGKLVYKEDIQEGLANYVPALNRLFDGSNTGKLLLKID